MSKMDELQPIQAKAVPSHMDFESIKALSLNDPYLADHYRDIIMEEIKAFEAALDDDHEVCLHLTSFGKSITLSVTEIGYYNPQTIVFYGYVDNQFATLIQHVSQLNFLLIAVKKSDPEQPPRRVGFSLPNEE